jgi:hypothetical protein
MDFARRKIPAMTFRGAQHLCRFDVAVQMSVEAG